MFFLCSPSFSATVGERPANTRVKETGIDLLLTHASESQAGARECRSERANQMEESTPLAQPCGSSVAEQIPDVLRASNLASKIHVQSEHHSFAKLFCTTKQNNSSCRRGVLTVRVSNERRRH